MLCGKMGINDRHAKVTIYRPLSQTEVLAYPDPAMGQLATTTELNKSTHARILKNSCAMATVVAQVVVHHMRKLWVQSPFKQAVFSPTLIYYSSVIFYK